VTESKFSSTLKAGREQFAVVTDRVREGLAGRRRQVTGIVALAGIATLGITAAAVAHPGHSPATTSAAVAVDRQAAADRANRDARAAAPTSPSAKGATPAPAKTTTAPKPVAAPPKYSSPLPGASVTSCYGQRWGVLHAGIDFAAAENTPEHAVQAGTVYAAGWNYTGYGISVVIDHGNGVFTHYAHMNKANVKVGQKVTAGQVIGYEGSTGDSTGPHLHFEVHMGMWNQINPAKWLSDRGIKTGC